MYEFTCRVLIPLVLSMEVDSLVPMPKEDDMDVDSIARGWVDKVKVGQSVSLACTPRRLEIAYQSNLCSLFSLLLSTIP